jgi:hypothetical protein
MPIPSSIDDLSPDPGDNFPQGFDTPDVIDNVLREHAAYLAQLRDGAVAAADALAAPEGAASVGHDAGTVADALDAHTTQIADILAGSPALEDLPRLSPLATQSEDFNAGVLSGIGHDRRIYQATPSGLWPQPDADMANPLGDGYPVWSSIAQTYSGAVPTANLYRIRDDWVSVLFIIPTLGQSLAGGANDNATDTIYNGTPTYPAQAFMPSVGNKPDGMDFDTLQPLREIAGTGYDTNWESPLSTMVNTLISDLNTLCGAQPKFATFMASRGARTWAQIGPGNEAFDIFVKGIKGCAKAARKMGLRPVVPAVMYLQGEQDRSSGLSRTESARHRLNMAREVNRVVKEITHQTEDVIVFVSQPNNSTDADGAEPGHMLAPVDVDGVDCIRMLPPHYPYNMPVNVHPDSASYLTMGGHLARAIREEVFGPGYYPLKIVQARWFSSTQIDLIYSANSALVIDTTGAVVSPPSWGLYGFQVFDTSGQLTISSASVVTDTTMETASGRHQRIVRLTLSAAPSGRSVRVHYATRNDGTGANSGRLTGPRGCVRDSAASPLWASSQVVYL